MAVAKTGAQPVGADTIAGVINAAHDLAKDVGPAWGLAIVVAICIFMPRFGVLVHLAKMFKEDRADARQQKLESERLIARHSNRVRQRQGRIDQ